MRKGIRISAGAEVAGESEEDHRQEDKPPDELNQTDDVDEHDRLQTKGNRKSPGTVPELEVDMGEPWDDYRQ